MSLRSALVDDLKNVTAITDICSDRIYDMFYEYEDYLNSESNKMKFPAVSIVADENEHQNNLDGHDGFVFGKFTITCFQIVNLSSFRSRIQNIRNRERDKLRVLCTLSDLIISYLKNKRGIIENSAGEQYKLRQPKITDGASDFISESFDNRDILAQEISYEITYTKEN